VKRLPQSDAVDLERLDLREVLDFRPDQGIIRLQEKIAAEDIKEKWSGKLSTPASAS